MSVPSTSRAYVQQSRTPTGLPKTIEGAVARYFNTYQEIFQGDKREMTRLSDLLEGKLVKLRTKAPRFYDQRLYTLINQAASSLLTCNMKTHQGQKKFNETHRELCIVLDNLLITQPAGEADFPTEQRRVQERDRLNREHIELRKKLDILDATELDLYDEDDLDNFYKQRDKVERDLSAICKLIAEIEGEDIYQIGRKFRLCLSKKSLLNRLTQDQIEHLEEQIEETLNDSGNPTKDKVRLDKGVVDVFIQRLDLSENNFTKEDLIDLAKDTLDGIREFFRELEYERVSEFHDAIMKSEILQPKEGLILKGPDDVPPEISAKLDQSARRLKRQIDETLERYAEKQGDNYSAIGDDVSDPLLVAARRPTTAVIGGEGEDDLDNESDDDLEQSHLEKVIIDKYKESHPEMFARIKEEPRDDYLNDCPSEDEIELNEEDARLIDPSIATDVTNSSIPSAVAAVPAKRSKPPNSNAGPVEIIEISDSEDENEQPQQNPTSGLNKNAQQKQKNQAQSKAPVASSRSSSTNQSNSTQMPPQLSKQMIEGNPSSESSGVFNGDDTEDDDIQELGVVEPSAKKPCITLE